MLVFGVKKNSPSAQQSHFHSVCLTSPWSSRHRCSPTNQLSKGIWGDTNFRLSFLPVLFFETTEPFICWFKTFREGDLWADMTFQLSFIYFHRTLWFSYSVVQLVINCYPTSSLTSKILRTLRAPCSYLKCIGLLLFLTISFISSLWI